MLPGMQADEQILTNIEVLSLKQHSEIADRDRLRRRGRRVRQHLQVVRRGSHHPRDAAALRAGRRRRSLEGTDARLSQARHQRLRRTPRSRRSRRPRLASAVTFTVDGKQQKIEAEKVLVAIGRAPRTENVGIEKTKIKVERGFVKVDELHAHRRAGHLRHRRHRRRISAAGALGRDGRHRRGHAHRRQAGEDDQSSCAFRTRPIAIPRSAASA